MSATERPKPVDLDVALSDAAWDAYQNEVWSLRLDAQMQCRYWLRIRRALGVVFFCLQLVVTLSASGAVAAILLSAPKALALLVSLLAATCSLAIQVSKLPEKLRLAEKLVEAWAARASFWDEAWLLLLNGEYLGPLQELRAPEGRLASEASGFWNIERWKRQIMDAVEASDTHQRRVEA